MNKKKVPSKVEAMYESVLNLLYQGIDFNTMKVADITAQAGIGKGTAYEYFKCKEDIIANALVYNLGKVKEEVDHAIEGRMTLWDQLESAFLLLEEDSEKKACLMKFIHVFSGDSPINSELHLRITELLDQNEYGLEYLIKLICQAKERKEVREELPDTYVIYTLMSRFISYGVYLEQIKKMPEHIIPGMKELIMDGLKRELSI